MQNKINPLLNSFLWLIRIVVGGLFIFSGLVKANDPMGLAYKMGEFFEAWAIKDQFMPSLMHVLNNHALAFSVIMISLEIVAGIALIIGYCYKFFAWIIFLLTAFFTFLTAYVLFSGNIKACGCFGDCIPLTPKETFTKDIVLLILITILLLFRKHIHSLFSSRLSNIIILIGLILSIYMQVHALKNLPYKDCLPYKVGNNIKKEMTPGEDYKSAVYDLKMLYTNLKTGKQQEFKTSDAPWEDTLTWRYDTTINKLISEEQNAPKILDFNISDYDGNDLTETLLSYPQNMYVLFIKDVSEANTATMKDLQALIKFAKEKNIPFVALSASDDISSNKFKQEHKLDIDFYRIDGTVCKTAMRTNPGLMLWNKGTILGKWSYSKFCCAGKDNFANKNWQPIFPEVPVEPDVNLAE